MIDYYVRHIPLPRKVEGVSIPNDDGSFDIYINSALEPQRQQAVLEHELRHLKGEHFYLDMPIERMELEAEGEQINPVLHPPEGMIARFSSEAALAHWIKNLCHQKHIKL